MARRAPVGALTVAGGTGPVVVSADWATGSAAGAAAAYTPATSAAAASRTAAGVSAARPKARLDLYAFRLTQTASAVRRNA